MERSVPLGLFWAGWPKNSSRKNHPLKAKAPDRSILLLTPALILPPPPPCRYNSPLEALEIITQG